MTPARTWLAKHWAVDSDEARDAAVGLFGADLVRRRALAEECRLAADQARWEEKVARGAHDHRRALHACAYAFELEIFAREFSQ